MLLFREAWRPLHAGHRSTRSVTLDPGKLLHYSSRGLMHDPLEPLLADGVIDEVVARLNGGKEADVWLVRHGGEVVTAKVYRARHIRSFKNDAVYKEGRRVRNTRTQRAMDRGSRFGRAAAEDAWKMKESDALHRLHAAGVRVPRPVLYYEGVLLMEAVVDAQGRPAPRLVDAPLAPEQAAALYADLRKQVVGMLVCDLVHGDLSPFNVLVGWNGPVLIDFPQVMDAAHNRQAETFLLRDLRNIHRFCAALDPALRAAEGDGAEIWRAYVRRELTVDFVPTGRGAEQHARRPPAGGGQGAPWRGGRPERSGPRPPGGASPGAWVPSGPGPRRGEARQARPVNDRNDRGPRPHGAAHPPGDAHVRTPPAAAPRRPQPGARRGTTPEVIRVVQLAPRGPTPPAAGNVGGRRHGRRRRRR